MAIQIDSFTVQRARYPAFSFPNLFNSVKLCKDNKLSYVGSLLTNNKRTFILGEKKDIDKITNEFINRIFNEPDFIKERYRIFEDRKKELIDFTKTNLTESKVRNSSNEQLLNLLLGYYNKYENLGSVVIALMLFVNEELEKQIKEKIKPEHGFLLECPTPPYITAFKLDYFEKCSVLAEELARKWEWIPFDYIGPEEWDKNYFLRKMGVDLSKIEMIKKNNQLKENQEKVLNEYDPNIKRVIKDFHYLSIMQDGRKEATTLTHPYLQKYLFKEISKRTNLKIEHLRIMVPNEIRDALLFDKKFDDKLLDKRLNKGLILFHENDFSVYLEEDDVFKKVVGLLPLNKSMNGTAVSKGIVKGKVKICLTSKDLCKVNNGDILVAPMTSPDYIVAMDKAAGFITDEGGVTCHAAIISREMKKPCIVGTQCATELLKDGDYIELDADNCEIRRI